MMRGAPCASRPETARSCSAGWTCPCSSSTSVPGASVRSCAATSATSQAPGRKTSASMAGLPASARAWADAAVAATWDRKVRLTPRSVSRVPAPGAQSTVSGCSAEGQSTTAAGPSPGGIADQRGKARGIEGCGHGQQHQVPAQFVHLAQHADQQVGLEAAFVHLVDDDRVDPVQPGIGQQASQQDAGGHEFHERFRAGLVFPAHAESDAGAQRAAVQRGKAPCGGARGNPAGLGDEDAPGSPRALRLTPLQHQVCHERRHQGRLARAGRRLDDGRPRFPARIEDPRKPGQGLREDQPAPDVFEVEGAWVHGAGGCPQKLLTHPVHYPGSWVSGHRCPSWCAGAASPTPGRSQPRSRLR